MFNPYLSVATCLHSCLSENCHFYGHKFFQKNVCFVPCMTIMETLESKKFFQWIFGSTFKISFLNNYGSDSNHHGLNQNFYVFKGTFPRKLLYAVFALESSESDYAGTSPTCSLTPLSDSFLFSTINLTCFIKNPTDFYSLEEEFWIE